MHLTYLASPGEFENLFCSPNYVQACYSMCIYLQCNEKDRYNIFCLTTLIPNASDYTAKTMHQLMCRSIVNNLS